MKSILFDHAPDDITAKHSLLRASSNISGGDVFYKAAVEAILTYSSYDKFLFLDAVTKDAFPLSAGEMFKSLGERVDLLSPKTLKSIMDPDKCVLCTPTENGGRLLPVRSAIGEGHSPFVGFVHAAHPSWILPRLLMLLLNGIRPGDAVVSASQACRVAFTRMVDSILDLVPTIQRPRTNPFETPLIPNGVDCGVFNGQSRDSARRDLGISPGVCVILYFGRFYMFGKCDFGPLLIAFHEVRRRVPQEVVLILAGGDFENKLAAQVQAFCRQLQCHSAVMIRPNPDNDEKLTLYAAADIYVSPADGIAESFGIAPVEAMAAGLPVIVSDWDGYRETVVHGETGYRVPTYWTDLGPNVELLESFGISSVSTLAATTAVDVGALVHHLEQLVTSPSLRQQLGCEGRRRAQALFDWRVVVKQYDALFDSCLETSQRAPGKEDSQPVLSHQRLFEGYPTCTVSDATVISLTNFGDRWLKSRHPLAIQYEQTDLSLMARSVLAINSFGIVDDELARCVAGVLAHDGPQSVLSIVQELVPRTFTHEWLVRLNVMRILKYGVATPVWPSVG